MSGQNYYILTALPALADLGSAPPLDPAQMLEHVADHRPAQAILEVIFLSDDLIQRQAILSGETDQLNLAVLTNAQVRNEQPLPAYLEPTEQQSPRKIAEDALWDLYFRHAHRVARTHNCDLLADWTAWELALRNSLAAARAKALQLEPTDYQVAVELTDPNIDFLALINEWAAAATPLTGQRTLDRARWDWLDQNDRWFSFSNDELAAYGARLMLLQRWHRLTQAPNKQTDQTSKTPRTHTHDQQPAQNHERTTS